MARTHRLVVAALSLALAAAVIAVPASGAGRKPDPVKRAEIVGASRTSLTLDWAGTARAKRYTILMATNLRLTDLREIGTATGSSYTAKNLKPGKVYCFKVKAVNGAGTVPGSTMTCRRTLKQQGRATGSTYRFVTYNVCSNACSGWLSRRAAAGDLVEATEADVVAAQEIYSGHGLTPHLGVGFREAINYRSKSIFFRESRFGEVAEGRVDLPNGRAGVWALLQDRSTGRLLMVGNLHATAGEDTVGTDRKRRKETRQFMKKIRAANTRKAPLVIMGDFNSHKSRRHDSPAEVMRNFGLSDSFDLARRSRLPNHKSANGFDAVPRLANGLGAQIDQVWVDASTSRVRRWENAARLDGSRYATPIPSDHSPILAVVRIN